MASTPMMKQYEQAKAACPDALSVYRATLAAQPDGSVVICSVGALSNLEDLLRSGPDEHSDR